jgi:hypothetical protein
MVRANRHAVTITEDPRFMTLAGFVASSQVPPKINEARHYFSDAFVLKHEPDLSQLRAWYSAESSSGYGFEQCITIADFVAKGRRYAPDEKLEFLGRKGTLLYRRAKECIYSDGDKAVSYYMSALELHLFLHKKWERMEFSSSSRTEEYSKNTAYQLFDFLILNGNLEAFVLRAIEICAFKDVIFDPIEAPLIRAFEMMGMKPLPKAEAAKLRNRLETLRKNLVAAPWDDPSSLGRIEASLAKVVTTLKSPAS